MAFWLQICQSKFLGPLDGVTRRQWTKFMAIYVLYDLKYTNHPFLPLCSFTNMTANYAVSDTLHELYMLSTGHHRHYSARTIVQLPIKPSVRAPNTKSERSWGTPRGDRDRFGAAAGAGMRQTMA